MNCRSRRSLWTVKSIRGAVLVSSTSPFPRTASRTRRARFRAPGAPQVPFRTRVLSSFQAGPRGRDDCSPVAVTRGGYLGRVEQRPFVRGRPPSDVAVAAAEVFPCGPAVFAPQPSSDLTPRVVAQVGEGAAGNAGPEVDAPALERRVELTQQGIERLARVRRPAHHPDLAGHGLDGLAG